MSEHDSQRDDLLPDERAVEAALTAWELGASPRDNEQRVWFDTIALATAAVAVDPAAPPVRLRRRLAAAGSEFCARIQASRAATPRAAGANSVGQPSPQRWASAASATRRRRATAPFALGGMLGVAAGAALSLWLNRDALPDPSTARQLLLAKGAQPVAWRAGPSASHGTASGDVTWSTRDQQGFLRIAGLQPLDPDHEYQLWIVDADRPGSAPVDGGLFTLTNGSEHVIAIDPRLPVRRPTAFVVTVEPKGGVVVSEQQDVVAIASL